MNSRYTALHFVIGLFFVLASAILISGYLVSPSMHYALNLYTGLGLLTFGVCMMLIPSRKDEDNAE